MWMLTDMGMHLPVCTRNQPWCQAQVIAIFEVEIIGLIKRASKIRMKIRTQYQSLVRICKTKKRSFAMTLKYFFWL
jgi:hypothetical protein